MKSKQRNIPDEIISNRSSNKSIARNLFSPNFHQDFGSGSDLGQMWLACGADVLGYGSDVAQMWLGYSSDVARTCFGGDRKSPAEIKGKRFFSRIHSL